MKHAYTIEHLLAGCKKGDRQAQKALYESYATKMMAVCMRYAHSTFEAEDMLQNGFVRIFSKMATFEGAGSFEGWMRRIMVNTAIEIYRKNQRSVQTVDIDTVYDQGDFTIDMAQLEAKDLMKLVQQLPAGYQMVFNLYAIEGYSHAEIAKQLDISEGASKSQLSRARTWLKEKIKMMEGGLYERYTR
ncbi:RNA polymerase sigma factor [Olivibacter sitiensis]|uniref:RNA polymerase sigma factor n=1 Tax=Olivibacter sitiensis TaxID=376470 RepID=UPI0004272CD3|nr:RNA polymerase sigma factor [Olivibacter sitiensis]